LHKVTALCSLKPTAKSSHFMQPINGLYAIFDIHFYAKLCDS
jgi:hypothetical protein